METGQQQERGGLFGVIISSEEREDLDSTAGSLHSLFAVLSSWLSSVQTYHTQISSSYANPFLSGYLSQQRQSSQVSGDVPTSHLNLSATSFNPSIANNSPFMPLAKSTQSQFLPQGPLLSSTPAQAFPVSTPSFQLNSQPPALPQAALPTFTPGIPLNFSFGQSTDTSATNIFLGPLQQPRGGGLRSGGERVYERFGSCGYGER